MASASTVLAVPHGLADLSPRFSSTPTQVSLETQTVQMDALVCICPVMWVHIDIPFRAVSQGFKPTPQEKEAGMADSGRHAHGLSSSRVFGLTMQVADGNGKGNTDSASSSRREPFLPLVRET